MLINLKNHCCIIYLGQLFFFNKDNNNYSKYKKVNFKINDQVKMIHKSHVEVKAKSN